VSITKEIKKVLDQNKTKFNENPEYRNLKEFYKSAKKDGIVLKKEYSLNPLGKSDADSQYSYKRK